MELGPGGPDARMVALGLSKFPETPKPLNYGIDLKL